MKLIKTHEGQVKELGEKGEGQAVIATLGVVDRDGDLTEPGAFGEQTVPMVFAHDWVSRPPIGKATIREEGNEAVARFRLNLKTEGGREVYEALRFDLEHGPAKQAWSYGFSIPEGGAKDGVFENQPVRFLKKLKLHEISPVLLGAGVDTRTVAMKRRTVAMKGLWLTLDQVKRLCPPCAERMRSKGIGKIALAELAKSLHGEGDMELIEAVAHVNEAVADLSEAAWLDDPERRQEAVSNAIAHLERAEEHAAAVLEPDAEGEEENAENEEGKAFAGYDSFEDCVAQNQDKDDPEAYCAVIQAQVEGEASAGKRRRLRVGDGRKTMAEQIAATVAAVETTVKRWEEINDLRLKGGRDLSPTHKEKIAGLVERMGLILRTPSPKEATRRYFDLKARTIKGLDPTNAGR